MSKSKIEWTDDTWNPVTGCTPVSEACQHCYAKRMAQRLAGRCGYPAGDGFAVTVHRDKLREPLRWKKPRKVFVVSMGDLFHPDVSAEFIYQLYALMATCGEHTFMLLTKRAERMREVLSRCVSDFDMARNIWCGVTAENQARADERIPVLLQTPAAVRFLSCEPLLGPINLVRATPPDDEAWEQVRAQEDLDGPDEPEEYIEECEAEGDWINYGHDLVYNPEHRQWRRDRWEQACFLSFQRGIQWVIVGGETGSGARPMDAAWARGLRDQCSAAGVPFFFKKMGGERPAPEDLRVREWPR